MLSSPILLGVTAYLVADTIPRRVESDLRPLMRDAAKSSFATSRKADKDASSTSKSNASKAPTKSKSKPAASDSDSDSPSHPPVDKHAHRPKEFQTVQSSAPRRLNDIAQAPPEFKKVPIRGVKVGGATKSDGVLSLAQKQMMEEERENVVRRYRELKARQKAAA